MALRHDSIHLVFSSLEIQRRFMQTRVYCKLFHSAEKETSRKPLKVAAIKEVFPKCAYH